MLGAVWPCGLVDIEIRISVRVFYQLQYVLEQFFLGQRPVSGCRLPFGNLQMHIVEVESHCAQDDVHTLLDGMLVRIYLGNIIGADDDVGFLELPEILKVTDMGAEGIVLPVGVGDYIEKQLQVNLLGGVSVVVDEAESVLDELVV